MPAQFVATANGKVNHARWWPMVALLGIVLAVLFHDSFVPHQILFANDGPLGFLMADCTSGNIVFTLPTAAGNTGRIFYATKIDNSPNTLTVAGNGGDIVNELSSLVFGYQDQEAGFISTGSGWRII